MIKIFEFVAVSPQHFILVTCPRSAPGLPLPVSHASGCFLPFMSRPAGHGCGDRAYPKSFQLMFALSGRGGMTWAVLIPSQRQAVSWWFCLGFLVLVPRKTAGFSKEGVHFSALS